MNLSTELHMSTPTPADPSAKTVAIGKKREQSLGEEIANSITHGLGLLLAIAGLVVLLLRAGVQTDLVGVTSVAIYGATLVTLYLASTLYHSVQTPRIKRLLRVFDHTAIYLLIAGTYTPLTLITLRAEWGWPLFSAVWSLALIGILCKLFAFGRFKRLSLALYLGMGWLAVVAISPLMEALAPGGLALIAGGGLAYTLGVVFYVMERRRYFHTIWHVFVMGGSVCHYLAVLLFILPAAS
jgi:hemolysin III